MALQKSGEAYLEAIYILSQRFFVVRSIDVSKYMGYSKPSVSYAVALLRNGGYLETDEDGYLTLTDSGMEIAQSVFERHQVLAALFRALGVDEETAAKDAFSIKHNLSDKTFHAVKAYLESPFNN